MASEHHGGAKNAVNTLAAAASAFQQFIYAAPLRLPVTALD